MIDKHKIVIDLETTGLDPFMDQIVWIGYKVDNNPVEIVKYTGTMPINIAFMMTSPNYTKVMHNANFDLLFLARNGLSAIPPYFDTNLYFHYMNPNESSSLKTLGEKTLGVSVIRFEDLLGAGRNRKKMTDLSKEEITPYLTQDIELTESLYVMAKDIGVPSYLKEIEFPLIDVILDMELRGFKVNKSVMMGLCNEYSQECRELESYFNSININPRSPKQLSKYLSD